MNKLTTKTSLETVILKPLTGFVHNKCKDDWKLNKDMPIAGNPELKLCEFMESGESFIKGDVLFERAEKIGNCAGQQHAEQLLAQEDSIPEEWQKYHLVFPGTKWRRSSYDLYVSCLTWKGNKWHLDWEWIGNQWYFPLVCNVFWFSHARFVRCR